MKILYISYTQIPSKLANTIHIMEMCQSFAKKGHKVTLLAPLNFGCKHIKISSIYKFYGVDNFFKIKFLKIPEKKGKSLIYALRCGFSILKCKPDIVYGRFDIGCLFSALLGYKTIFETHMPLANKIIDRCIFFLLAQIKSFRKLIVITSQLKYEYTKLKWLKKSLIKVVPDGANMKSNNCLKIRLPGRKLALKIGYVGHLYNGKGIEVIENIANRLPDIDFHIVGGYDEDINRWKQKIPYNNVYFHGFIERNKVQNYIDSMDICLLPNQKYVKCVSESKNQFANISRYTSPLKLFEYMAQNKPIIASDLPVIREVLNENNAILVKSDDYPGWINAINKLRSQNAREIIAERAYLDFINNYTWTKRAEMVLEGIN